MVPEHQDMLCELDKKESCLLTRLLAATMDAVSCLHFSVAILTDIHTRVTILQQALLT